MHYLIFAVIATFFLSAHPAKAVPPPDFIFNVGTQIAQFFSISVLFLSVATGSIFQFLRQKLVGRQRVVFIAGAVFFTLAAAGSGAWWYSRYVKQQALQEWIVESERYKQRLESNIVTTDTTSDSEQTAGDNLDQLVIGHSTSTKQQPDQADDDAVAQFIRRYYNTISTRRFSEAYGLSKQAVSFQVFQGWYVSTTAITIDKLQRIDSKKSSLELTLTEGLKTTRYGVLMDLRLDANGLPVQVERSSVRILSESDNTALVPSASSPTTASYFDTYAAAAVGISNADFKSALADVKGQYLVLDAREDIEFENGHFPDATHIRFADLKAGRWIELPTDRPVYVFCWSGIRGKEVAEFLRSKKIAARYLEKGADGWVKDGGRWVGDIAFMKVYTDDRYKRVFTADEVESGLSQGVVLVDTRSPNAYATWHIPGSLNIPLMSTPSIMLERAFSQVAPNSKVITVCDGYVNCFDAKLTGVELGRRGHTFFGRFAEPWKLNTDR